MDKATWGRYIYKYLWIGCLSIGFIGFLISYFLMPRESAINSIWPLLFKIIVFLVICVGIAFFPTQFKHRYLLLFVIFIVYTGYIGPKMSFYGSEITKYALLEPNQALFKKMIGEYYTLLYLVLYPFLLLGVCFAYRIGNGTPGNCLKLMINGALLLFSGLLDLMWWVVNPVGIPDLLTHAHHTKVILGHYPTYPEAVVFFLCHLPIMAGIFFLPLDKWIRKMIGDDSVTSK